ncbi:acyl-ACP--UDP-N- acetylglucosamine O-acyltransferase [Prescottella equi]|uniref:DapH/DapD/GlmU-related protein n=1 Tax=Rhodococcus hoagii TaxID=43767 RepID=UPI000A11442C|nr:DapH/DapD/GlmU-related protein [Prescottella equi]NKR51695.1 acyl-ACP--UDP-N- acetylglucosamine O-acyltransferase [Prescottella equi]NKR66497.1 acyl-ACP--UDP-N- acetylglucosamine O-acyltransferase [Prescottella equi]NKT03196.1 acyl-ACP--UDP-N- acetylglucosamine O-acyltransferase [Prescottella equi]NKV29859.1 acyl-ACP--UDP-N- acetylglucosamine O-acyltransferase [Prescottella equi]NKZ65631.1 acyl-ACP--UDP-N- acetylglucosamine O-acyltransferase [Prescottella equi]
MSIGQNCHIHPTAVIGDAVVIGDDVTVGPHAVLTGPLTIGDRCWIGAGAVLGAPPEILGAAHPQTWSEPAPHRGIVIGADTTIRELTTVHHGSERETIVGARCFVMNRVAIEHDVQVGDGCVVSAGSTFAGHVSIGAGANIGMHTVVHQRRVVGAGVVTGMGTVVVKDVPPYAKAFGNPVEVHGVNRIGMSRSGIADADIDAVDRLYAPGSADGSVPDALTPAFDWWRERAVKPLALPLNA